MYFQEIGYTMAIPCNDVIECIDGSDESGCDYADFYLNILRILSLIGIALVITCFVSLKKQVKKVVKEIKQDRRWRLATENENSQMVLIASKKLIKVAFHADSGNIKEVNKLLCTEMRSHANESRMICCLKVKDKQ